MAKGVSIATTTVTKEQALDALYMLAKDTPVDTGLARSNWRLSVGRPLTGVINAYRPFASRHRRPFGMGGSKSEGANLAGVMRTGKARLARYTKGSIYVTNAVPHIGPLDRGHSKQTAAGFVARAILAATVRTRPKIKAAFDREFSK